jgi:hypothetical protein
LLAEIFSEPVSCKQKRLKRLSMIHSK